MDKQEAEAHFARGQGLTSKPVPFGSLLLPLQLHLSHLIFELGEREDTHPFREVSVWIQDESLFLFGFLDLDSTMLAS
jgi:hypothetical protein